MNPQDLVSKKPLDPTVNAKIQEQIGERIMRVGRSVKKNYMNDSQLKELTENDKIVKFRSENELGINQVELVLEPNKRNELSQNERISVEEYIDAINTIIDEEESEWDTLRPNDIMSITQDKLLELAIMKYAKKEYEVDPAKFSGKEISYNKRYNGEGQYIGSAYIITLTRLPGDVF